MAKPVIFDDGGSIRIREMDEDVTMDGLIGHLVGGATVFNHQSNENFGATCTLTLRYFDEEGVLTVLPPPNAQGNVGFPLNQNDIVLITSAKGQNVTITFGLQTAGYLFISLDNSADAQQDGHRRRYLMKNAGKISTVKYTTAAGAVTTYNVPANAAYAMVHFGDVAPHSFVVQESQKRRR